MLPNLKALRMARGISQQKLGDVIGITQQAINRYENQNIEPDISTLIALADFFETTVDYLVGHRLPAEHENKLPYELTKREAEMMDRYRTLNAQQQNVVDVLLDSYHND